MRARDREGFGHSLTCEEVLALASVEEGGVENWFSDGAGEVAGRCSSSGGWGVRVFIGCAFVGELREGGAGPVGDELAWGVLGCGGFDLFGAWDGHFCGLVYGRLCAVMMHGYWE